MGRLGICFLKSFIEVTRPPLGLMLVTDPFATAGLFDELFTFDVLCFEVDGASVVALSVCDEGSILTWVAGCARGAGLGHTAATFLLALSFFFLILVELVSLEDMLVTFLLDCCEFAAVAACLAAAATLRAVRSDRDVEVVDEEPEP